MSDALARLRRSPRLRPLLRALMLLTDLGFLAYWLVTALHLLPAAWLFKDYDQPILQSWNWSFLPLDLAISASGLGALWLVRRGDGRGLPLALVSLTFTVCSGLMAVAFWTLRHDYELTWWLPNLFLLLYPLPFLPRLLKEATEAR
jgi:Family of unknown function (DUF5360)